MQWKIEDSAFISHGSKRAWAGWRWFISATLLFLPLLAAAQTTGSIYGTVTDTSGAVIPHTSVVVVNIHTGESHTAISNESGNYNFPVLAPGDYAATAKVQGFQSVTQTGIILSASQNVHVNFAMPAGSVSQSVEVTAGTTLVDTRSSQLGETVDQRQIQDLPLNGRDAYSLVTLVPGITNFSPGAVIGDNNGTMFSSNGLRTNFNSYYLDGAYDTAMYRGGGNLIPNPDALQEFRILTTNFDAELGRYPGAVVNIITRSGTNHFHGLIYDYLRNDVLNSQNFFSSSGATPLKQNQFGANFGGPIFRDKAFFFGDYQGLRIHTPITRFQGTLTTLTPLEKAGNFSQSSKKPTKLPANLNCGTKAAPVICPAALDPVAQAALAAVPLEDPTSLESPQQEIPGNLTADQGLGRIDYQLTASHKLSGTFFDSVGEVPSEGPNQIFDYSGVNSTATQTNVILADTWITSPSSLNQFRIFYTLNKLIKSNLIQGYKLSDLGSNAAEGTHGGLSTQPQFQINGYWTMGVGGSGPTTNSQTSYGLSDTFNWQRGNQAIKFGGSFMLNRYQETANWLGSSKSTYTGKFTGNALADFELGESANWSQNSGVFHRLHAVDPALFFQDNWKLTHKLTVDLGLRWEVFPPFSGQKDFGTFIPGVQSKRFPTAPLGLLSVGDPGVPDGVLHTSYKKFAPRVGFAYDLFGNGKTSLRGGYGIFYSASQETFSGNLEQEPFTLSVTLLSTPNLVDPYGVGQSPFPYTPDLQNPVFTPGATMTGMLPNTSSIPYVQEYNLTLEQQYGVNWATRIAYVGNIGRRFYALVDQNAPIFDSDANSKNIQQRRPYQPYHQISLLIPASNSSYNALQVSLIRKFANHFTVKANYVWSKTLDDVSADPAGVGSYSFVNQYDIGTDWGLSSLDLPQRFVASYLWELPSLHRWGLIGKEALSGWQVNGITVIQTGGPFNVTSNEDSNFDGIVNTDRPDVVGNPNLGGNRSRSDKIAEYFNTAAYAQVPAGVPYGNSPRNPLLGPGTVSTDLSAFKAFALPGETSLQFRAGIFNLFNNVNLANPNGVLTAGQFGKITAADAPRIIQLALRYSF